jgi:hypothetical protein
MNRFSQDPFELPDGTKFIIVILPRGAAGDKNLLATIGRHLLGEIAQ